MIVMLFYGTLASLALWATWKDRDLRLIGLALMGGFIASNILHASFPVTTLPGPYSFIELAVLVAAFLAFVEDMRRRWPLVILGGVNILSIIANIAFAALNHPDSRQIFLFEVTTNICFAVECLIATTVGVADGYRTGRFDSLPRPWRRDMAPDAARKERP